MAEVVTIIEDNPITGVKYGTVEIPETTIEIKSASERFQKTRTASTTKIRGEHTKHK
ncbi:MAG: hypothetical protein R8M70_04125 [Alphaproteobacteria bacterium]|nr:hypothetical protein [Alphaproteobacteria bacterium]